MIKKFIQTNHQINLFYDNNSNILFNREYPSNQENFYHKDNNKNTVGITDHKGKSIKNYRYTSYGIITHPDNPQIVESPYSLTQKQFDQNTGLYYFGSRHYDGQTGTWMQQDKYRGNIFEPRSLHRYQFNYNSPVNYYDYYGYSVIGDIWSGIKNLFGGNTGTITSSPTTSYSNLMTKIPTVSDVVYGDLMTKISDFGMCMNVGYVGFEPVKEVVKENKYDDSVFNDNKELQTIFSIIRHEGTAEILDPTEYLWLAHTANNNANLRNKSLYNTLMGTYSSVPQPEKIPFMPGTSKKDVAVKNAILNVLNKGADPTGGATYWDGSDFLAWGLNSPNGTPQNKFEEYRSITINRNIFDKYIKSNINYYGETVRYSGSKYSIPADLFLDPSNWVNNAFQFSLPNESPFYRGATQTLEATGSYGLSIFWKVNQ